MKLFPNLEIDTRSFDIDLSGIGMDTSIVGSAYQENNTMFLVKFRFRVSNSRATFGNRFLTILCNIKADEVDTNSLLELIKDRYPEEFI